VRVAVAVREGVALPPANDGWGEVLPGLAAGHGISVSERVG
jgi:hypothetical protein